MLVLAMWLWHLHPPWGPAVFKHLPSCPHSCTSAGGKEVETVSISGRASRFLHLSWATSAQLATKKKSSYIGSHVHYQQCLIQKVPWNKFTWGNWLEGLSAKGSQGKWHLNLCDQEPALKILGTLFHIENITMQRSLFGNDHGGISGDRGPG